MNIKLPKSKLIALTASLPTSAQYSTILSKTNIFLKMNQLWKQQHIKTTMFAKREFV